jgi:histidinol-phosphate aminotransferase
MVYLANPDNPAGTYLGGAEIRRLHAGLPDHVLLVLDCAYEEYVDAPDYEPGHKLVEAAENVVMTRTFSKIFGLDHVQHVYAINKRLRNDLSRSLSALGLKVYPSQTNFLLMEFPDPDRSAEAAWVSLRRKGIEARRFAAAAYRDCLRITLGLESEVMAAEQAIEAFLQGDG